MFKVGNGHGGRSPRGGHSYSANYQARGLASSWPWTAIVVLMIVLGGSNIAYPLMRTLSGLLGGIALAVALTSRQSRWSRPSPTDWILVGILALFAIQLIPLPPSIWSHLGGRAAIAEVDQQVFGAPLWRPLSIDTEATLQSLAFLIPFFGIYAAHRSGTEERRAALLRAVPIALGIAVALGVLQMAGLEFLHPFPIEADNQFGNGFFTNHNHQATFVVMAGIIAASLFDLPRRGLFDILVLGLIAAVALATVLSGSRAGIVVLAATFLACAALLALGRQAKPGAPEPSRHGKVWLLAALTAILAAGSALIVSAERFAIGRGSLLEDQRLELNPIAWKAVWQFWPWGSGFGTFQTPFRQVEPLEALRVLDVTHAHNDLLEAMIEGGIFALALIAAMVARIAFLTTRAVQGRNPDRLRTALLGIALLAPLLHSLVDYPLRTMAIAVLFALTLASLEARGINRFATNA